MRTAALGLIGQSTTASLIDGTSASVASYAPVAVPEPAALSLLALGAGLLVRRSRRH